MTTPEIRITTPSGICATGFGPDIVTGVFLQILRQHFSDQTNLEDPYLRHAQANTFGNYVWKDAVESGILIETSTKDVLDKIQARPAIFVKRNSWNHIRRGIGDINQWSSDGNDRYTTFVQGSHTVFALATRPVDAEKLGWEVTRQLKQFSQTIRKNFGFHRVVVMETGALGKLKEAADHWTVPVSVAYAFEENVTIRPDAPKLKRIVLAAEVFVP